jgi:hypothetical protein
MKRGKAAPKRRPPLSALRLVAFDNLIDDPGELYALVVGPKAERIQDIAKLCLVDLMFVQIS